LAYTYGDCGWSGGGRSSVGATALSAPLNRGDVIYIATRVPVPSTTDGLPVKLRLQDAIDRADRYLSKRLVRYLKKLEELALGIVVQEEDRISGKPRIYGKAPDRQALESLIAYTMGKPVTRTEITGEGGAPIGIVAWAPASSLSPKPEPDIIEGEARVVEEA